MENKKYQQALIQEATLQNNFYNYTHLQPCAYLWKQLVKGKEGPALLVPDTLLLNDKQSPLIWIFTNDKGKLQKSTNINLKDFVSKITNYCSPNQLSATLKRVTYNDHYINGNDVKLLNSRYLQNASFQQLGGQSEALITIQRYIKSNGNNAFICRTVWRKTKHSECFLITNKKSYYDKAEPQAKRFLVKVTPSSRSQTSPSTIIKCIQGKHLSQTCKRLTSITDYMKSYRGIIFSEIVGDFIKDESGNWWLINVKAFQIECKLVNNPCATTNAGLALNASESLSSNQRQKNPQPYSKQKYQKTKVCRYCEKSYLQSQLTHYMTIRMLIETDRYLLHLGKSYKWLKRSDIQNVDSHCLYQQHKICERCYRLYLEIQQLMEVEKQFLKNLGFQMETDPKQLLMSLTNEEQLKNQSKNKQLLALAECSSPSGNKKITSQEKADPYKKTKMQNGFPKSIELGPNSNIIFQDDVPIKNDHMINKMIRYRFVLYLKEIDQIQFPSYLEHEYPSCNFFMEYQLFGVKNKVRLDFSENFNGQNKVLTIKKLKINYFFAHSHQEVYEYLSHQDADFSIKIFVESKSKFSSNQNANTKTSFCFNKEPNRSFLFNENQEQASRNLLQTINEGEPLSGCNRNDKQKRILIGRLQLPIKQFFNNLLNCNTNKITKKDFYKFFSVNNVAHGWGLQGSIGIIPSESYVNTARMIFFTQDNLIYLPNQNYYFCEHLPEQWIDVIKKQLQKDQVTRKSSQAGSRFKEKTQKNKILKQISLNKKDFQEKIIVKSLQNQQINRNCSIPQRSNAVDHQSISPYIRQKNDDQILIGQGQNLPLLQQKLQTQKGTAKQNGQREWRKTNLKSEISNYQRNSKQVRAKRAGYDLLGASHGDVNGQNLRRNQYLNASSMNSFKCFLNDTSKMKSRAENCG